jgi:hypothetical protein
MVAACDYVVFQPALAALGQTQAANPNVGSGGSLPDALSRSGSFE